jgi:hypothetical protein
VADLECATGNAFLPSVALTAVGYPKNYLRFKPHSSLQM